MKKIIVAFILLLPFLTSYSQCDYLFPFKYDTTYHILPLTEGFTTRDKGLPPHYYNDNGSTLPIKLPFHFCFYNKNYDTIYVNNNGNISFTRPVHHLAVNQFPYGADTMMIAPFYADIDSYSGSKLTFGDEVYYKINPTNMIIIWYGVGFYDSPLGNDNDALYNTFQLIITDGTDPILPPGNNVSFYYDQMFWAVSDTSGGMSGFEDKTNAIHARIGINKGDKTNFAQLGTFGIPGTQYYGPYGDKDGLYWLNRKSFTINTCVNNTIPPIIMNAQKDCDTVKVCNMDTSNIVASFFLAKQGQTDTFSISSPTLNGVKIIGNNTANGISTVTVQLTPATGDTGLHIVSITATDNNIPPQASTSPIKVLVQHCSTGIDELKNKIYFSISPNPGSGIFSVNIDAQGASIGNEAKVYDIIGNETYSKKFIGTSTKIDLTAKPKGIYFLKLYNKKVLLGTKKFILQ